MTRVPPSAIAVVPEKVLPGLRRISVPTVDVFDNWKPPGPAIGPDSVTCVDTGYVNRTAGEFRVIGPAKVADVEDELDSAPGPVPSSVKVNGSAPAIV
jgi:hypothetical protein